MISTIAIPLSFLLGCFAGVLLGWDRGYRAGIVAQQRVTAMEAEERVPRGKPSPVGLFLIDFPTDAHAADALIRDSGCCPPDEREPWEGE